MASARKASASATVQPIESEKRESSKAPVEASATGATSALNGPRPASATQPMSSTSPARRAETASSLVSARRSASGAVVSYFSRSFRMPYDTAGIATSTPTNTINGSQSANPRFWVIPTTTPITAATPAVTNHGSNGDAGRSSTSDPA